MTDADKILQAIEALHEGQNAFQTTVEHQGKQLTNLQTGIKAFDRRMDSLDRRMDSLEHKMETLELKMEAFHAEQTKANGEIIRLIVDASDADGEAQKALEKRVDRIEKHLDLPPVE